MALRGSPHSSELEELQELVVERSGPGGRGAGTGEELGLVRNVPFGPAGPHP